jgi:enoyl-CoA hydratase/carnithine racemase
MSDVGFEPRDGVAAITLSRPERLNAVTPAMVEDRDR